MRDFHDVLEIDLRLVRFHIEQSIDNPHKLILKITAREMPEINETSRVIPELD